MTRALSSAENNFAVQLILRLKTFQSCFFLPLSCLCNTVHWSVSMWTVSLRQQDFLSGVFLKLASCCIPTAFRGRWEWTGPSTVSQQLKALPLQLSVLSGNLAVSTSLLDTKPLTRWAQMDEMSEKLRQIKTKTRNKRGSDWGWWEVLKEYYTNIFGVSNTWKALKRFQLVPLQRTEVVDWDWIRSTYNGFKMDSWQKKGSRCIETSKESSQATPAA